jgi:hypothetical protein
MVWEWRIARGDAASRRGFLVCTVANLAAIILSKVTLADTPACLLFDSNTRGSVCSYMSFAKQCWD